MRACMPACSVTSVVSDSVARQAPLSMGFFRQEYWSGLPYPPLGDLPDPGIEPVSLMSLLQLQAGSLPLSHLRNPSMPTDSETLGWSPVICILTSD